MWNFKILILKTECQTESSKLSNVSKQFQLRIYWKPKHCDRRIPSEKKACGKEVYKQEMTERLIPAHLLSYSSRQWTMGKSDGSYTELRELLKFMFQTYFPGSQVIDKKFNDSSTKHPIIRASKNLKAVTYIINQSKVIWVVSRFKPLKTSRCDGILLIILQ